MSSRGRCCPTH